jgi:sulfate transport system substrate-binding protein
LSLSAALLAACGSDTTPAAGTASPAAPARVRTLVLGAYTTPREAYGQAILPAFREHWRRKTGEDVRFEESYLGSGAQARAIVAGFEADVAALSLEPDVETIAQAGLIRHDWKQAARGGMVTRSLVVLGVRAGNPKQVRDWSDLAREDLEVLKPNVKTSGGAMWNVLAITGAVGRGKVAGATDPAAFLASVLGRVRVMDKGARESLITFENGVGDAIVTYENEVLVARAAGQPMDYVVPAATIRIDNPAAVVDAWAEKHGNQDLAREFVAFLVSPEAQRAFARFGLRPVDDAVAQETSAALPRPADLFTIDDLGGWAKVRAEVFAPGGTYDRAVARKAAQGG